MVLPSKPAFIGFLMLGLSAQANSNPASTEFVKGAIEAVRNEINTYIASVRNETNSQVTTVNNVINNRITVLQNQLNQLPIITPKLGERYQGGIVFWLDASKQHGLIAAVKDLPEVSWRNGEGGDRIVNAKANGLYAGLTNTRLIVAEETVDDQEGIFAGSVANHFSVQEDGTSSCPLSIAPATNCYGDWYLPSLYEVSLMYKARDLLKLSDQVYWSSTEFSVIEAYSVDFGSGLVNVSLKSLQAMVRPIRAF